ncbi:hypothetical protein [Clostridium weizhouense]|uniref:Uncharacterized protein n=1 Tax=Clostridium weizhouense TaxID=2859781 RepID=A0ABS7ANQ4_9CLOT|nr:hypothetical protein [Clostridium weizhouense]MBW6410303.1 hypothetical protein [Clostridium weizhouense]
MEMLELIIKGIFVIYITKAHSKNNRPVFLSILCDTASANLANSSLLTKFTSLSDKKYTTPL